MNTNQLIESYITSKKAQGAPPNSVNSTRCALRSFSAYIGNRPLSHIGIVDIEVWLESGDHAPSTLRCRVSAVRCFYRWCQRRNYVKRNPAVDVKGPRSPRALPRALASGAPARVIEACPDARARFIVTSMCQQGLRCCEVSRLEMPDIDLGHRTMKIHGKAGHQRILPLMEETELTLEEYLLEHPAPGDGPVVRSYNRPRSPLSPSTISRLVSDWMLASGVKAASRDGVSAHAGRHTCAADMLLNDAHLRDVQAALGHAHLSSTERYLPLLVKGLDQAMKGRTYHGARRHP